MVYVLNPHNNPIDAIITDYNLHFPDGKNEVLVASGKSWIQTGSSILKVYLYNHIVMLNLKVLFTLIPTLSTFFLFLEQEKVRFDCNWNLP